MSTYGVGCKAIKAGDIGAAGIMGTVLTDAGTPYKGTVQLIEEDGTVSKHYGEGKRFPFLTVYENGSSSVKFTLTDMTPATLAKWLGGAVNTTAWDSSKDHFSQELSLQIDTVYNMNIQIARCHLYGKITWNLTTSEIAKIEITGDVLEPEDADTPPIKWLPAV